MFDQKTINYGRIEFTSCAVYVYSDYNNRRALSNVPNGIIDARWVGRTVHVKVNGWTYVYDGFGNYSERWPS